MNKNLLSILLVLLVFGFIGTGSAIAKKNLNKSSEESSANVQSQYTAGVQGASAGIKGDAETIKKIKEEQDKQKANSIYAGAAEEEETISSNGEDTEVVEVDVVEVEEVNDDNNDEEINDNDNNEDANYDDDEDDAIDGDSDSDSDESSFSKLKEETEDTNDYDDENDALDGESVPMPEESSEKK